MSIIQSSWSNKLFSSVTVTTHRSNWVWKTQEISLLFNANERHSPKRDVRTLSSLRESHVGTPIKRGWCCSIQLTDHRPLSIRAHFFCPNANKPTAGPAFHFWHEEEILDILHGATLRYTDCNRQTNENRALWKWIQAFSKNKAVARYEIKKNGAISS